MSYIRSVRIQELVDWLEGVDYEALLVEEIAQRLIDRFDILTSAVDPV